MARLTVLTDLTGDVTRAELLAMWTDATFTPFAQEDFDATQFVHESGETFQNASSGESLAPGQVFYHKGDQVQYIYIDVLGGTGVSLWTAIGPDRFEVPCLCAEPIPAGAVVEPYMDRWVKLADPDRTEDTTGKPISYMGICQSGIPDSWETRVGAIAPVTQESGTWISVGIEGFMFAWFPSEDSGVSGAHFGAMPVTNVDNTFYSNNIGVLGSGDANDRVVGGLGQPNNTQPFCDHQVGYATYTVTASSGVSNGFHRILFHGLLRRST